MYFELNISSKLKAERARKQSENELIDANDRVNELSTQVTSIQAQKRKLEADITAMTVSSTIYYVDSSSNN